MSHFGVDPADLSATELWGKPERDASAFRVAWAPELAQYVADRGAWLVVPSRWPPLTADPSTQARAAALCEALNRVYAGGRGSCNP